MVSLRKQEVPGGKLDRRLGVWFLQERPLHRCITIMRLWLAGGVSGTAICGAQVAAVAHAIQWPNDKLYGSTLLFPIVNHGPLGQSK